MKTITRYECELCGEEYESADEAMACEQQETPLRPILRLGQWVNLYVRGLKDEQKFVRARAVSLHLGASWGITGAHEWMIGLDREVHLVECWGEGGAFYHRSVPSFFLLQEEDLSGWAELGGRRGFYLPPDMERNYADLPEEGGTLL